LITTLGALFLGSGDFGLKVGQEVGAFVLETQFFSNVFPVGFHGQRRKVELGCDFRGGQAGFDHRGDFDFVCGEVGHQVGGCLGVDGQVGQVHGHYMKLGFDARLKGLLLQFV